MARHVRYTDDSKIWPYGRVTAVCTRCGGTGGDCRRMQEFFSASKSGVVPFDEFKCTACDGHGRILTDDYLDPTKAPRQSARR